MSGIRPRSLRSIWASDEERSVFGSGSVCERSGGKARMLRPLLVMLIFVVPMVSQTREDPQSILDQAMSDFQAGRIDESVAGFDAVARLAPRIAPQLWQRGIALYYAGRYENCRAQFESHRTVNPNDVENAAWHFLCVARSESLAEARSALLPVGPDRRTPMREIYEMFRGDLSPEDVVRAGGAAPQSQFYAYLYAGLYLEALGDSQDGLFHIRTAAEDRYRGGGYMHAVARIHVDLLERRE
jgi:lipoprotein NlpI